MRSLPDTVQLVESQPQRVGKLPGRKGFEFAIHNCGSQCIERAAAVYGKRHIHTAGKSAHEIFGTDERRQHGSAVGVQHFRRGQ